MDAKLWQKVEYVLNEDNATELGQKARDPERGFPMTNFGELKYTTWGGGLPVMIEGQVIGAVAVNGLPEKEDMEIAEIGRMGALGIL